MLAWLILRGRLSPREREREREPEVEEALARVRELVRRPRVVIGGASIVALGIIAALARNPGRWAVMLLALAVLAAATTAYVVADRRRRS